MSLIANQIRQEAYRLANTETALVFAAAGANLVRNRFQRLRKRQTEPINELERAYMYALNEYVYYKIRTHRARKYYGFVPDRAYIEVMMDSARSDMDCIEHGLASESLIGKFRVERDEENLCSCVAFVKDLANLGRRPSESSQKSERKSTPSEKASTPSSKKASVSYAMTLGEKEPKSSGKSSPIRDVLRQQTLQG